MSILSSGSHVHSQKVKSPLVNDYPYNLGGGGGFKHFLLSPLLGRFPF